MSGKIPVSSERLISFIMRTLPLLGLACLTLTSLSCASQKGMKPVKNIPNVRTTAYTHTESDHIQYGKKTADGTTLKYGERRSAAADWSVFPVGTVFKVEGEPYLYEVDDYGSALVGTNTVDLYKPTKSAMNEHGVKHVNIKVMRWGSYQRSLAIMKPRTKYPHVRQMVDRIESGS
jgi:3D (Asp-Asp-Asp) domain-containing protein